MKVLGALVAIIALSAMSASAAQAAKFTSANYPASATGSSTGDVFDAFGSSVKCTENSFTTGTLSAASETLTVTPSYNNCTAFGTLPATVDLNKCDYTFAATTATTGTASIGGAECTSITVTIFANSTTHKENKPMCILHIFPQGPLSGVTYTSNANGTVSVGGTVSGITATQTRNSILCPSGTETKEAKYTIQSGGITMTGNNGAISVD